MFRSLYSTSARVALPLARPRVLPTSALFARTIVTKRYTEAHERIVYDSETKLGTVSITDYAQKKLGDVVFVELQNVGSIVSVGETLGTVESVKAASDIYAPVSGIVKEVNSALDGKPSLINTSPEEQGWLCKIEVLNPSEMDKLLSQEQYTKLCEGLES